MISFPISSVVISAVKLSSVSAGGGTHPLQNRAAAELRFKQDRLERVPEYGFICRGVSVLVRHGEQLFELVILIMPSCAAVDDIPVDIYIAASVISLEVRSEGIVPGTVPYYIFRTPLLKVSNILIHNAFTVRRCPRRIFLPL